MKYEVDTNDPEGLLVLLLLIATAGVCTVWGMKALLLKPVDMFGGLSLLILAGANIVYYVKKKNSVRVWRK